ncbi:transposase [Endozoicomonas montiporae]|uniref:Transposase n=2 Tax=Endozoicomonas montiporae TaxID=1027273 RepID=A0A081NBI1_9GAMM|nr:RNA-guided endonuclease TnpB family protein [Endozoicomonas montiporae]AMO56087.1 IS200/IS605 family transposase [Endozoicomonas montiporae CL-33]KEQ15804.1 transposase [Endozoicomonas montiporae]
MLKATKVRIYPTPEQTVFLNRQFGAVRMVWNKALAIKTHYYKVREQNLSPRKDLKPLLVTAKKSRKYSWLKEADSIALQQSVINLDKAFQNFFNPKLEARFPRFKSKHGKQSSYHCMSVAVGENWVKVPKCKPIKARIHREITGTVKSITLTKTPTGKFYASVLAEDDMSEARQITELQSSRIVGVDVGLTDIAITSTGVKTGNPRFIKNAQRNLKRKQKALSRCKKGSKGRVKARLLVAKAHERVAFARNDFQHKLSRQLIDENQAVIVETLKVKNMLKNHCLARSIADAGWHSLVIKLDYKAKQAGKHLVKIDQWFASSKTCSCCDRKQEEMPLNIRSWTCECGYVADRDINAAINVKKQGILKLKAEGLSVSADGGKRKSSTVLVAA